MNNLEWNRAKNPPKLSSTLTRSEASETSLNSILPPFMRRFNRLPHSIEMKATYDAPTRQSTYTYSLTWEDELGTEKAYQKLLETYAEQMKKPAPPTPVRATCDGPCRRAFPSDKLYTMGRCGHYLCEACNGIVKNSDGTNGCSSLQCNWNGKDQREARRNFEKDICKKQREHANDLKAKGFSVVPVSAKSSRTSLSQSDTESDDSKSNSSSAPPSDRDDKKEGDNDAKEKCTHLGKKLIKSLTRKANRTMSPAPAPAPGTPFQLVFPTETEFVSVKLVVVEPAEGFGIFHTTGRLEAISSTRVMETLTHLLKRRHRNPYITVKSGELYYAEPLADGGRKLVAVEKKRAEEMCLYNVPMINEYVVFVLDMGEFVKSGIDIFYE